MPSIRATRTLLPASIGCPDAVRAGHREPRNSACPGLFGRISEVAVPTSPASESLPTGLLSAGAKRRRLTKKAEAARTEKTRNCGASPVNPTPANSPTTTAARPAKRSQSSPPARSSSAARTTPATTQIDQATDPDSSSRWRNPRGVRPAIHPGQTACNETRAAQFSRWGLGRQSIPAKQPVMKPARPSSPGGGSAGDPSRLNRVVAPLIVAFRSKYTRASSPGGGSSLTRLVSRAPRPHRDWPASALTWVPPPAAGSPETAWAG